MLVSDTFTRADSALTLGTADTGQAWSALAGTWGIASNQGYLALGDGTDKAAAIDAGVADCTVQVTLPTIFVVDHPGLTLRASDNNNWLEVEIGPGTATLYKRVAGVYTSLGSASGLTLANGDVFKAVMLGTSVKIYQNGTQVISVTETFSQTATKHGLSANNSGPRFDNFRVTVP